ncbi:MAG TPA: putative molybdenum carrier protein [Chthoniobacterales bacterium]|jgi:GT2 family glycosyltransferase
MKIISGGQTGVDRAALDVARSLGIECGGWCPEGRLAEDGRISLFYPLQEVVGGGYLERTERNVRESDGTVIIHAGELRGGTRATFDFCRTSAKPALIIDTNRSSAAKAVDDLHEFVRGNRPATLNVAGPRESEWPHGYEITREILTRFLKNDTAPKLSFIVPAHNEEHELPETLRRLRAAAEAGGEMFEIIVVDDASTDATAEIARQAGAQLVQIKRRQIAAARNAGGRVARGEIVFFVDADTHIAAKHVRSAMDALAAGYSGGSARVAPDRQLPFWGNIILYAFSTLYFATGLGAGAFLFTSRVLFEKVGGFDEQYFAGEEVYFSLALKKIGPFKILRAPIVTSARKLRMHAPRFILSEVFLLLLGGKRALRTRERLSIWYDGKRERPTI